MNFNEQISRVEFLAEQLGENHVDISVYVHECNNGIGKSNLYCITADMDGGSIVIDKFWVLNPKDLTQLSDVERKYHTLLKKAGKSLSESGLEVTISGYPLDKGLALISDELGILNGEAFQLYVNSAES